mmetsp:Transcript_100302/g.281044  ORF Transcript_100302/g.281044 Transcript_100302/m.281044 type:complete len:211 (+) Transcript_100302:395-1027(+)
MARLPLNFSFVCKLLMHMRLSKGARAPKTQQLPQCPWLWILPMISAHSGHASLASHADGKALVARRVPASGIFPAFFNSLIWPFVNGMLPRRLWNFSLDSCTMDFSIFVVKPKSNLLMRWTSDSVTTGFWLSKAACAALTYFKLQSLPLASSAVAPISVTKRDLNAVFSCFVSSSPRPEASTTWSKRAPAASSVVRPFPGLAPRGKCAVT